MHEHENVPSSNGTPVEPPTCNTGVGFGWDWSSTTHQGHEHAVADLVRALTPATVLPGAGLQGWSRSLACFDAGGFLIGKVYFGGRDDVHVVSTSAAADGARGSVTSLHGCRTARVDTRVDSLASFDELATLLQEASMTYGSRVTVIESSERGESLGRTIYLGSPSSWVRIRLYQKWLESPGEYADGTNRVEVQLRPPSRVKEAVSSWTRAETFGASKVTRDVALMLGEYIEPAGTLQRQKGTPDLQRSMEAMAAQYGPAVRRWLDVSGGDVGTVLDWLTNNDEPPPF